jgi:hypothetical protein
MASQPLYDERRQYSGAAEDPRPFNDQYDHALCALCPGSSGRRGEAEPAERPVRCCRSEGENSLR